MNWFYAKDGEQIGPVDFTEIERLQTEGSLTGETLVWQQGTSNWVPLSTILAPPAVSGSVPPALASAGGTNSLSIASLVFAILGLLCCGMGLFGGVAAVICGHLALKRGGGSQGLAKTGLIIGYVAIALNLLGFVVYLWATATGAMDPDTFQMRR